MCFNIFEVVKKQYFFGADSIATKITNGLNKNHKFLQQKSQMITTINICLQYY